MDRTKLKGYAALLLVFVLGILLGGASSRAILQRRYRAWFRDPSVVFERRRLGALAHRLKLDDTQEDRARDIFGKYAKQRRDLTREIMVRCGARLHAQKIQMDSEIRALLRPDQQARYDQLIKDSEAAHPPPDGPLEPLT
jgi:Spy/CpxP family protein refolding chaperone